MQEIYGDMWSFDGLKVITTNGFVKKNGECVMGRGCAKQAALRYPDLPKRLGRYISDYGNHVFWVDNVYTFPVKHNWWENADLNLIKRSAEELAAIECEGKNTLIIPRPGCGNGRLTWDKVKRVIEPIFKSDNFKVVHVSI